MAVAHVISAEQRAVETVASIDVPHSLGYLLEHTQLFCFYVLQHRVSGAVGCTTQ